MRFASLPAGGLPIFILLLVMLPSHSGCENRSSSPPTPAEKPAAGDDETSVAKQDTDTDTDTERLRVEAEALKVWQKGQATGGASDIVSDEEESVIEEPHTAAGHAGAKKYPPNHLAKETSPYLLMHAHNPVHWYAWGEEAFAKARTENKPIFLSIGYSSCYWCHVMERESFMDEEIAALLNKNFVAIKVDREERPDVDEIYMTSLQIMRRRGGWPMSVFLTPEGKPFFGGTYFPPRDGRRGMGFLSLLGQITEGWTAQRDAIESDAEQIAAVVKRALDQRMVTRVPLAAALLEKPRVGRTSSFDAEYGGFGYSRSQPQTPKFPQPPTLLYLLARADDGKDKEAERMAVFTLERMAMGGIRDHLGGGFHRYSVDRFWQIPHFEKMLYDNGQLATVYAEAYRQTGRDDFRRTLIEMLDFVARDMTDPRGGFYSALDAESEAIEGKSYRWERDEVQEILGSDDYTLFAEVYGIDGDPNFEHEFYAPQLSQTLAATAAAKGVDEKQLDEQLRKSRDKLLTVRDRRIQPLTDTKILTAWNGMMIRGFADAGRVLEEPKYVAIAAKAADFVLANLRTDEGRLLRTLGGNPDATAELGPAKLNAYLDDYANLVDGLIALHRATGDARWLATAEELTEWQNKLFWDERFAGYYTTSNDHETLIARARNFTDSVRPAGAAVAVGNLVYLGEVLEKPEYLDQAQAALWSLSSLLGNTETSTQMPRMAMALASLRKVRPDLAERTAAEPVTDEAAPEEKEQKKEK